MKCIQSLSISLVIACIIISCTDSFSVISSGPRFCSRLPSKDNDNAEDNSASTEDAATETMVSPAAITMDDGGSDLTDRFKYKVHALMGTYDLPEGKVDDENQMGNILGAMLTFPTEYTFSVVGKNAESEDPCDNYSRKVRAVIESVLGESTNMEMRVKPRGKRFTKVSIKVTVDSAAAISTIYEELDALKATVMKF